MISSIPRPNELEWVTGMLKRISDEIGFEICRRMTELPPIGYQMRTGNESMSQSSNAYSFMDPVSGFRSTFVPVEYAGSA
jgi:hypothetical protein